MRNIFKHIKPVVNIIVLSASVVACSNAQFSTSATNANTGGGGGGTTPTCTSNCGGGTPVTPTNVCSASSTVPLAMTGGLSNGTATINLYNTGDGVHYSGNINVSYSYYGQTYNSFYSAPGGDNVSIYSLNNNGQLTASYNSFYNGGKNFSGFFQNSAGAVVVSISGVDSNGCASGSIYYENFANTGAIQSPYRECWFITEGPYDCQDGSIMNKSSLVPGSGYALLGTFTGLPVSLSVH